MNSARTAADSVWWRAFDDPALNRLIEIADKQNLPLQIAGLAVTALGYALALWATSANPFFSSSVRIQADRLSRVLRAAWERGMA